MNRIIFGLALALTIVSPAYADLLVTQSCVGQSCVWTFGRAVNPHVRTLPAMTNEQVERDRAWVQHCRPTPTLDRYGVTRYTYAVAGCEFGLLPQ